MNIQIFMQVIFGVWIGIDVLLLACIAFGVTFISKQYPDWWKSHICDEILYEYQMVCVPKSDPLSENWNQWGRTSK